MPNSTILEERSPNSRDARSPNSRDAEQPSFYDQHSTTAQQGHALVQVTAVRLYPSNTAASGGRTNYASSTARGRWQPLCYPARLGSFMVGYYRGKPGLLMDCLLDKLLQPMVQRTQQQLLLLCVQLGRITLCSRTATVAAMVAGHRSATLAGA